MTSTKTIRARHGDVMLDPALTTPIAFAICKAVYHGHCQCERAKSRAPCEAMVLAASSAVTLTAAFLRTMAESVA